MGALGAFIAAAGFLTRLPVGSGAGPEDLRRGTAAFPLVGFLLGGTLAGIFLLLRQFFPPAVTAALLVALGAWLTGGLHLDGLMDTADGLGSGRPRQQTLAIMRDSRVGAQGVLAALLLLLLRFAVYLSLPGALGPRVLFAAPAAARWNMVQAITGFPYLRPEGLGSAFAGAGAHQRAWALFWTVLGLYMLLGPAGLLAGACSTLAGWFLCRRFHAHLGGLTGDTYGALAEVSEVFFLLVFYFAARLPARAFLPW